MAQFQIFIGCLARGALLLGSALLITSCSAEDAVDIGRTGESYRVRLVDASFEHSTQGQDQAGLVPISFHAAPAPSVEVSPTGGAWAWSSKGTLRLDMQNGMPWPVTVVVDITSGEQHLKATVGLNPGAPQTVSIPLRPMSPRAFGMHVGPPMPFTDSKGNVRLVALTTEGEIDATKVSKVTLSMPTLATAQTVLVGKMVFVSDHDDLQEAYQGIVDKYGQYTRSSWPEKVSSDAELIERASKATSASSNEGLDTFGGRTDLPRLQSTGFFRTQKHDGRWWLVSPEGHPFFSLGVNAVNLTDSRTYVDGREFMFVDGVDESSAHVGTSDSRSDKGSQRDNAMNHGRWWDIYTNNLARTLGDDFLPAWRKRTIDRLRAWHFNTLGNWSEPGLAAEKRIAYTVPVLIYGEFNSVGTGYDYWGRMPDPFDPEFVKAAETAVAKATEGRKNDPWLLGYFADNELAWAGVGPQGRWALAVGSLVQAPHSPAKQAFLAYLKDRYHDAPAFAKAWGVDVSNWADVEEEGFKAPEPSEAYPHVAADYIAFLKLYAGEYFRVVAQTLKRADPNHMFLGGRLAVRTPEVEEMSSKYADVTSINTYSYLPEHGFDVPAFQRLDKPVMLTEWHFGSADRGPFGSGMVAVANEEERGKAYARFVESAVASGVVVGTHWFQYVDQPVTGRILDGENAHVGLVGITDIPFETFTQAVTQANARAGGGARK